MKLAGGYLDQRVRRPMLAIGAGYLVAALSRVGVAFGSSWQATLAFRSLDRVGKGIRTAPRDALLASAIPQAQRGRAFGLHRAADTTGAVLGVILVLVGLAVGVAEQRLVLVGAAIGLTSLVPLLLLRGDASPRPAPADDREPPNPKYWGFLAVCALFYLGRVSYLFFILRAAGPGSEAGLGAAAAVGGYLAFNIVYATGSYPAGWLADRHGAGSILGHGFALAVLASLAFAAEPDVWTVYGGFIALGLSFAAVEGNARSVAASLAGSRKRSGRLGEFHAITGLATLLGGLVAGLAWQHVRPSAAFLLGAGVSAAAWLALAFLRLGGAALPRARAPSPEAEA